MRALLENFTTEIARSGDADKAITELVDQTLGVRLFTILRVDWATSEAERLFTNRPQAYPVSGRKPLGHDSFTSALIYDAQTMVMNTIEEIAQQFPDHELIQSLGCESCLNIPISLAGKVIGSLNFLDQRDHWTAQRIENARGLVPAGLIYLLLQQSSNQAH